MLEKVLENVQFIVDAKGEKTAAIVPIEDYEELLEDLHLGQVARESKNEARRPLEDVVKELREAGEIDV